MTEEDVQVTLNDDDGDDAGVRRNVGGTRKASEHEASKSNNIMLVMVDETMFHGIITGFVSGLLALLTVDSNESLLWRRLKTG